MAMIWLASLAKELEEITDEELALAEPDEELGPHEHVVGVMDDDLRKLYYLFRRRTQEAYSIQSRLELAKKSERKQLGREVDLLAMETRVLYELLALFACRAFPELIDQFGHIGFKKDWQVAGESLKVRILGNGEDTPEPQSKKAKSRLH